MSYDITPVPCPHCHEINEVDWKGLPKKGRGQRLVECFDCKKTFILHVSTSSSSYNFSTSKEND